MPGLHRRSALIFALFAGVLAAAPVAAAPAPPAAPAAIPADLPARQREFLEEAAPLLNAKEREAFLSLQREYQRDAFIRRFWEVRDPFPQTSANELRDQWSQRVKLAKEKFGGLDEDRARMLLINGPPGEIFQARCSNILLPIEVWGYPGTERIKGAFSLVFVSPQGSIRGPYRLWYPTEGLASLLTGEVRTRFQENASFSVLTEGCPQGEEAAGRIAGAIDWSRVEDKVLPKPSEEWLGTFLSYSTDVPAGAASDLPAQVDLSFPSRFGSRTVVQGLVTVPREQAKAGQMEGKAFYNFVVDGEVLRGDELFEHFRYRFTVPGTEAQQVSGGLPMVFQRYLRPGSYTLVLKVEDTEGKRFFREQRELDVPARPTAAPEVAAAAPETPSAVPAPPPAGTAVLAEADAAIRSDDHTLKILPPPQNLLTGKVRLETVTTGEGIARVSFELNGRPVLTKSRPPFSVELNLGEQPRTHAFRAVAIGSQGETLAEDELMLNAGPHRFAIRLVEPQRGKTYRTSVRAQAEVEVPEGEVLDRIEIYLNDTQLATLYQPPYVQPVLIPPGQDLTYVRAVAYLADGNSTEDLVMVNLPDFGDVIDVRLVELYTTVADRRGRPVDGLAREDFTVTEDGAAQEIRRFDKVRDLPIYAGVMIDTSLSMAEELDDAVRGALQFFQTVITPKDRAAVITFNDKPNLAVRFTNQPDVLAGSLAGVTAEGETTLYDSLIFALHYFGGIQKGKRAIILLSDGEDSRSKHPFNDALEFARRSGVALYTVGMNLSTRQTDIRLKLEKLADETGGRSFFITRASELDRIYKIVEEELRSQYLIAYQSSKTGNDGKFRSVQVKLRQPGLEAKTLRGYYP